MAVTLGVSAATGHQPITKQEHSMTETKTALVTFPVGTRVTATLRAVTPNMTKKQRVAAPTHTYTGTVIGAYTSLGADEVLVRWDGDDKPGAENGRRAHPSALKVLTYTYQVSRIIFSNDPVGQRTETHEFLGFVTARDNLDVCDRAHKAFPGEKNLHMVVAKNFFPVSR